MVPKLGGNDSGEIWCPSLRKNGTYQRDRNNCYNFILRIVTVKSLNFNISLHLSKPWCLNLAFSVSYQLCSVQLCSFSVRRQLIPPPSSLDTRNHCASAFLGSVPSAVTVNGLQLVTTIKQILKYYGKLIFMLFPPFPGRKEINLPRNTRNATVGLHSSKKSQKTDNLETALPIPLLPFFFSLCWALGNCSEMN